MKYVLASAFQLLLLLPVKAYTIKGDEYIPPYQITKNEKDASLKSTEALFVFSFKNIPNPANIQTSCNGLQKRITTDKEGKYSFKTKPSDYIFQLFYTSEYFEIYTDSIKILPGYKIEITVNFESSLYPVIMDKPVIYCYPQQKTYIHIDLGLKGDMLFTYPPYKNGWDFIAEPNGTITANGNQFKYLFWEGETKINYATTSFNQGSIIQKEQLLLFLETSLTQMGMNSYEKQDFITYWYPLMNKNEKNYIHFVFNQDYNEYASINISPKPDNMLRVYMLWANASDVKDLSLQKQEIPTLNREGFTLVEWGGSQLPQMPVLDL